MIQRKSKHSKPTKHIDNLKPSREKKKREKKKEDIKKPNAFKRNFRVTVVPMENALLQICQVSINK